MIQPAYAGVSGVMGGCRSVAIYDSYVHFPIISTGSRRVALCFHPLRGLRDHSERLEAEREARCQEYYQTLNLDDTDIEIPGPQLVCRRKTGKDYVSD